MTLHHCPRCRRLSLVHTGGFWACEACGYAITQIALSAEHRGSRTNERYVPNNARPETNGIW